MITLYFFYYKRQNILRKINEILIKRPFKSWHVTCFIYKSKYKKNKSLYKTIRGKKIWILMV